MKFLANENFPAPGIQLLRQSGLLVRSISEELPGISDHQVIEIAKQDGLIILTFDKDYGEIIFKSKIANPPAVVFFRFKGDHPITAAELLLNLIANKLSFENKFTVIEGDNFFRQKNF